MKAILSATALAGALALTPLAALGQDSPGQTELPETHAAPMPDTEAAEMPDAHEYRIIMSAEDLAGFETAEVRIESVAEAPRDHVSAIANSLDPANPDAVALRERLGELDTFEQALEAENVDKGRVVGAAIEEGELVVYILPEGETRETWGARMPEPTLDEPGAAEPDLPDEPGATDVEPRPGAGGSTY